MLFYNNRTKYYTRYQKSSWPFCIYQDAVEYTGLEKCNNAFAANPCRSDWYVCTVLLYVISVTGKINSEWVCVSFIQKRLIKKKRVLFIPFIYICTDEVVMIIIHSRGSFSFFLRTSTMLFSWSWSCRHTVSEMNT